MPTDKELQECGRLASELATEAFQVLKEMQGSQDLVLQKDTADFSTSADIAAEKLIIEKIKHNFPSHSIFSEEAGLSNTSSDFRWVIDPLDCTKEYARGSDDFNVLIALEYKDELVVAAYYRGINNTLYTSVKNKGAFMNGKKLAVSTKSDSTVSMLGFRLPRRQSGVAEVHNRMLLLEKLVNNFYRVRCPSDDAHSFAMVAAGQLDAHIVYEGVCYWYDIAPSLLLVSESGGLVTDFFGNPVENGDLSKGVVASNGKLHPFLIQLLSS